MKKTILLSTILVFLIIGWTNARKRKYKYTTANAAWMNIILHKKSKADYYMDISKTGDIILRMETPESVITKKGKVPVQIAKDFFREAKNSESLVSENSTKKKLVFYKGEILEISLYLSGELRRIKAPLVNFGEGFSYAFNQIKKISKEFPADKTILAFVSAQPLEEELLDKFRKEVGENYKLEMIETNNLKKSRPLLNAVKQPQRLIPLTTEKQIKNIRKLIKKHQLYGLRNLFYISTTRGDFKCGILASEKAPAKTGKKTPENKKTSKTEKKRKS